MIRLISFNRQGFGVHIHGEWKIVIWCDSGQPWITEKNVWIDTAQMEERGYVQLLRGSLLRVSSSKFLLVLMIGSGNRTKENKVQGRNKMDQHAQLDLWRSRRGVTICRCVLGFRSGRCNFLFITRNFDCRGNYFLAFLGSWTGIRARVNRLSLDFSLQRSDITGRRWLVCGGPLPTDNKHQESNRVEVRTCHRH